MSSTPFTEAEILAFFNQDSTGDLGLTDEDFAQLCALTPPPPDYIEYQPEVDAFFAELGLPTTQTQTQLAAESEFEFGFEFEPLPEAELRPLAELDMTPPEFVAFCGYDPSDFKSLDIQPPAPESDYADADAESLTVHIWSGVFEEITQKMQEATGAAPEMGAGFQSCADRDVLQIASD
ncbi:hypothetical protein LshimejAT787_1200170 [Lyophyllum shimeji]|uniref:Uncharacterized protein n=1 Tax=Lyophyllum shimeji TaxID=47721 RepID=A0A9P3PV28_LYOSH|nr:hypothetical protein LshimejAT787_1200170 [Lyophyllum shimeji]